MKIHRLTVILSVLCAALAIAVIVLAVLLSNSNSVDDSGGDEPVITTTTMMPSPTTKEPTEPWEKNYRLPTDTLPLHYDIELHPDLDGGSFTGKVKILIETTAKRDFLVVHTKYLNITSTKLEKGHTDNGDEIPLSKTFEYEPNEFWVIQLQQSLEEGNYSLNVHFNGSLTKDIVGFYRSKYFNDQTNQTRTIATSKFEPTYARRAFPCMDEPSFKSTFTVSLVRPKEDGYIALSNMNQISVEDDVPAAGLSTVKFAKSVPMVTYLACFIVCDFLEISGTTANNVPFRVFARPNQIKNTKYPLDIGIKVTDFYEKYFDIKYVLPKQDLIAIPDFVSGAMEHWGLVTFRETALLFDEKEGSTANQKRVATVVAHELAHQWFGNLMTIRWWDDLWLNEGFASYIEYKGLAYAEPDWDIETQMINDDIQVVLKLDAKLSSHPIVQPVNHPDEITEIFDTISYSKGASVLRMLEDFMGESNFQKGIQNFLKKFQFDNAATSDLWHTLEGVVEGLNVTHIMDTWTRQMGYPVLIVSETANPNVISLSQTRFLIDNTTKEEITPSPFGYKWDIPVAYRSNVSERELIWLYSDQTSINITLPTNYKWIKLNSKQNGFYRVNYTEKLWDSLMQALVNGDSGLEPGDRSGILDDAFSLAQAGMLRYSKALDLSKYIVQDRHPVPWKTASDKLTSLINWLYGTQVYPALRKYIVSLVSEPFEDVGWDDVGSHLEKTLRTTILDLACTSDYEACLTGAVERLQQWLNDTSYYLPPNVRTLVYRYGMSKIGDASAWDTMWQRYLSQSDPQESIKLLYGLSFTKEPWLIQQYLEYAKDENNVRSQDFFTVLEYISQNPTGLPIVWDFVRSEWEYMVDRFTVNNRYLGRMVNTVCSRFTTEIRLREMEDFFVKYPDAGAGARARLEALENVKNNIRWLSTYKQEVADWLATNSLM